MRIPRFGTDGVRGDAAQEITPAVVTALGRAVARTLPVTPLLVGRDTRESGPGLALALAGGVRAEGGYVVDLGVMPTPALAWASAVHDRTAAVISASHNPYTDNGVKVFAPGGRKLTDADEAAVEEAMAEIVTTGLRATPAGTEQTGTDPTGPDLACPDSTGALPAVVEGYIRHLLDSALAPAPNDPAPDGRLAGLRVVLDCANGAASDLAPTVFRRAGASVVAINAAPDGRNINAGCGSTHPEGLCQVVVSSGADIGLAFDGDADRVLAVDSAGNVVDGDQMIVALALDRRSRGALPGDTVVVTVMANLGLRLALSAAGITVVETPVGDRHVLESLEAGGWALGGEQSGHLIFRDLATTGDGLLTGLALCELVVRSGRPLGELAGAMSRVPQVLEVVRVDTAALAGAEEVWAKVAEAGALLGTAGRVLVRPSGTEPVVRVMVEATDAGLAEAVCRDLCAVVSRALGGEGS